MKWKIVSEYPTYEVSDTGPLRHTVSKQSYDVKKYKTGFRKRFEKNKKVTWIKIHDLVAKEFIPNPNNYGLVKHKDGREWKIKES